MLGSPLPVTGIVMRNSIAFIDSIFAGYRDGEIMVPLRPAADGRNIPGLEFRRIIEPELSTGWCQRPFTPKFSDEIAQISFTSGTEGQPKGILISHANLADMVDRLQTVMAMDDSIREYVGIPVYHSFGSGRCRAVATVGGHFYIPPHGFDPIEIHDLLLRGEINALSAVPSLFRVLFANQDLFGPETAQLKWIEIGSQYMSAEEKLRLQALFPNARIVQHYGLTEASRATFLEISATSDPEQLESVGRCVGDTEIRCTEDGRIAIKGSVVARQMLREGEWEELRDADGWLVTQDLGEIRDGYLYYLGRADDQINIGGVKVSPDNLERRLRTELNVATGIACARVPDPLRGDGILLAVTQDSNMDLEQIRQVARRVLNEQQINIGDALHVVALASLPVTDTGKVKRRELAQWAVKTSLPERHPTQAPAASPRTEAPVGAVSAPMTGATTTTQSTPDSPTLASNIILSPREKELTDLWCSLMQLEQVDPDESFFQLGGDSLNAMTAMVRMRRMGIPDSVARGILQGLSIRQLAAAEQATRKNNAEVQVAAPPQPLQDSFRDVLNIRIVRGILVLLVIAAHWSEGFYARLPDAIQSWNWLFAPLFSSGTPGFAVMYGVTLGYSFYPMFLRSPERLANTMRPIFFLLAGGVFTLALATMGVGYLEQGALTRTDVANSFYNVLTYYLLATLTVYFWFIALRATRMPILTAVLVAVFLHLVYLNYTLPLTQVPMEGFLELGKLVLAAKFNYLNMTSGVFLGLALGIALTQINSVSLGLRGIWVAGLLAIGASYLLSREMGDTALWLQWPNPRVTAWQWLFYVGLCLLALAWFHRILANYHQQHRSTRYALEMLSNVGLLAFPFFVTHQLVLPAKNAMAFAGLPNDLALAIALLGFIVASVLLLRSAQRFQFG